MCYLTKLFAVLITFETFSNVKSNPYVDKFNSYLKISETRNIVLKQGTLRGVVVEVNRALKLVEVYRGIPYATPPVGGLRFMPTGGSAPSWGDVIKKADDFGPVCPQNFPDEKNMSPFRKKHFTRLKQFLINQSEDCLYLNIYAPFQGDEVTIKYPVMVYIHGESFEWNSGNPYDGSVLAAYGNVTVVTVNFRLGILGFLKVTTENSASPFLSSNFGLVDLVGALLWIKNNIETFGGDPESVTLIGHGTGAVCASLLTISPMALEEDKKLFHRAILIGGTALAEWALAKNPRNVTFEVASALNCQIHNKFEHCLRNKDLKDIMSAGASVKSSYDTVFGPVVDYLVVPNEPKKCMAEYNDIFKRFELIYGVTELESIHLLDPVSLTHGMLDKERDRELKNYFRHRCGEQFETCFNATLAKYTNNEYGVNGQNRFLEQDKVLLARDTALEILSDARTVTPIVQMAKYHAVLNLQSYFYVFTHKTFSKDTMEYVGNRCFHGEDIPYIFGVPLGGQTFHFADKYSESERQLSKAIMTYFSNFANTGNPNVPKQDTFFNNSQFIEWPEFYPSEEQYLQIGIPPEPSLKYRTKEVSFWNDTFPVVIAPRRNKLPWNNYPVLGNIAYNIPSKNINIPKFIKSHRNSEQVTFGIIKKIEPEMPGNIINTNTIPTKEVKQNIKQSSTMDVIMIIGSIFLIFNLVLFVILYIKCYKNKKKNLPKAKRIPVKVEEVNPFNSEETFLVNGCNIVKMLSNSDKIGGSQNLSRQMSSSTLDTNTKVREWIRKEVVLRYSPRFLNTRRNSRSTKTKISAQEDCSILPTEGENDSTLGRSPTRPVSPNEEHPFQQPTIKILPTSKPKLSKQPAKISVGVDATPSRKGHLSIRKSVGYTKSLESPKLKPEKENSLRRSVTLEDFSPKQKNKNRELRKSSTSIDMNYAMVEPTTIKIEHSHSKSEPVEELNYTNTRKLKTFDPNCDINVTSRDENEYKPVPLTPEESLMTIKRRNFPKVLPDHPGKQALIHKRRSMPAQNLFLPIPEYHCSSTTHKTSKSPPIPPPRTTTLSKQSSNPFPICLSEPMLAEDKVSPEPEIVCNNLYVGPLLPKNKSESKDKDLYIQPIYSSLRSLSDTKKMVNEPKTVISANSNVPIKRLEPKIVVRPSLTKKSSDEKPTKHIPRVVVPDNDPQLYQMLKPDVVKTSKTDEKKKTDIKNFETVVKQNDGINTIKSKTNNTIISGIGEISAPIANKESSASSESTPSEESDTGTVVKRI